MDKRDYLGECNDQKVPLEDFQAAFCSRCLQVECHRSRAGNSKFEQRTGTWVERLFTETPRLNPEDPRYPALSSQNFINIDVGRTPEVRSNWVDPLTVQEVEPVPAVSVEIPPKIEPSPQQEPAPKSPGQIPRHMILANAPDQSGKMLPGAPPPTTQPVRDAWATPEKPEGTVVRRGATIKLGGGSGSGV
jgi:hypothetical protein